MEKIVCKAAPVKKKIAKKCKDSSNSDDETVDDFLHILSPNKDNNNNNNNNNNSDKATISVDGLLRILETYKKCIKSDCVEQPNFIVCKSDYIIDAHREIDGLGGGIGISGGGGNSGEESFATVKAVIIIRSFKSKWAKLPLFSDRIAVVKSVISYLNDNNDNTDNNNNNNNTNEAKSSSSSSGYIIAPDSVASLVSVDSGIGFITNTPGLYKLEIDFLSPFANIRKTQITIDTPPSLQGTATINVGQNNLEIKCEPALSQKIIHQTTGTGGAPKLTSIIATLPLTNSLSIQWTEKIDVGIKIEEEKKSKLPLTISASQNTLYSIGEGMLSASVNIDYKIINGSVSVFDVLLDSRLRILSVEGDALKKWELLPYTKSNASSTASSSTVTATNAAALLSSPIANDTVTEDSKAPLATHQRSDSEDLEGKGNAEASPPLSLSQSSGGDEDKSNEAVSETTNLKLLKIYLEYAREDNYSISIGAEMEMQKTSGDVHVPQFSCLGVQREIGSIGVEALTNVEINELSSSLLTTIDTSELPKTVWECSSNPILLAYKFLETNFRLKLKVKKHGDVSVLIAVIESAHYTVTHTSEGRTLTNILARVRNTQRQFVRVKLPENSDIWSTVVAGKPVKPAKDADGLLMIPLQKSTQGEGSNSDTPQTTSFSVELIYLQQKSSAMGDRGQISFDLPIVDLPINKLYVSIYLPEDYNYSEFIGDLKELTSGQFSDTLPYADTESNTNKNNYYGNMNNNIFDEEYPIQQQTQGIKEVDRSVGYSFGVSSNIIPHHQRIKRKQKAHGLVPVKISMPTSGKCFRFQQLLVASNNIKLEVHYKKVGKGWMNQRKLDTCIIC